MPTKTKEEILKEDLKESSENNTIDHNEEIDYSKYSVPGEAIARMLIEKLISLSIRQSKNIEIEKRMGDHCFDYIKKQVRPILEEKFIFHSEQNEKELFFSNFLDDKNTWIEIEEPGKIKEDRFMSTMIKMNTPFSDNNDNKIFDEKLRKNTITESKKELNLNLNDDSTDRIKEKKISIRNNSIKIDTTNTIKNISSFNKNKDDNKKKKNIILPIEAVDIPNIKEEFFHDQFDVDNIHELRQEMNEFIIKRDKEIKQKRLEEKLKEKEEKQKENKKKEKLFDFSKFTFDSNGEIMKFQNLKLDHLAKEFTILKNNIKNYPVQEMEIARRKSISQRKSIVITNPNDNNNLNDLFKDKKHEQKNEKIIPMGSNFDIMLPSVGVKIKENKKSKGGNMEFSKFFNKTSLEDYDKILNEFVPIQNQSMLKTSFASSTMNLEKPKLSSNDNLSNSNLNNISNNNNTVVNNNVSINNPLLNSSTNNLNISKNDKEISPNKNYNLTSNPLLSSNPFLNTGNQLNFSNLDNTIKMNSKHIMSSSLKLELDSLKNLTQVDEYLDKKRIFNKNLFNESILSRVKQPLDMTAINKFNTNIIKSRDWGSNRTSGQNNEDLNIKTRIKVKRNEYLRELGSTIMNGIRTKMPRQRQFSINI